MKIGAAFPSKFLKAADLGTRTFQVQITGLRVEDVGQEGKPEHKPVLYLSYQGRPAEKPLVLNRTNAETISMDLGDETDTWVGHTIELFSMRVQGPQGMTDGIRCRVIHASDLNKPAPAAFAPIPQSVPLAPGNNIPPSAAFRQSAAVAQGPFGPEPPQAAPGSYQGGNRSDVDDPIPF